MEYFDNVGNKIEIGDKVLILVPKTDKTYRQGIIKDFRYIDFRNSWTRGGDDFHCDVLVEYNDGRLYCNTFRWDQHKNPNIKFDKKTTRTWRSNHDIIKFKPEYIQ